MSGQQPADKVANDVQTKMNDKHGGGADQAYQTLLSEAQSATKGMSADQQKAFYSQLNGDLKTDGLLNVMTLEYAKDQGNLGIQDQQGFRGTVVDQFGVQRDLQNKQQENSFLSDATGKGDPTFGWQVAMDQQLLNAFKNPNGLGQYAEMGLTTGDIQSQIGDASKTYQQQEAKIQLRSDYPDLLNGQNGQPSALFKTLDGWKQDGKNDGQISQDDLKGYLKSMQDNMQREGLKYPQDIGKLPKNFDPNNPVGTQFNQEWYKEVNSLQKNWGDFVHGKEWYNPFSWGNNDNLTANSLAKGLGFQDPKAMWSEASRPTDGGSSTPTQPGEPINKVNADKAIADYLSLPNSIADQLYVPKSGETNPGNNDRLMTKDSVAAVLKAGGLTVNQEKYLQSLQSNWPNSDGTPISLADVQKAAGYNDQQLKDLEKNVDGQAQSFLNDVSKNISLQTDFNNQPITPDSIQQAMNRLAMDYHHFGGPGENVGNDPEYKALSQLQAHFNDLSRDGGKTVTPADLQSYAGAFNSTFAGFKADSTPTTPGGGDNPPHGGETPPEKDQGVYHVQPGDTLWNISQNYSGVTPETIFQYNKQLWVDRFGPSNAHDNPNFILIGWDLKIPPANWQPPANDNSGNA